MCQGHSPSACVLQHSVGGPFHPPTAQDRRVTRVTARHARRITDVAVIDDELVGLPDVATTHVHLGGVHRGGRRGHGRGADQLQLAEAVRRQSLRHGV